MPDLDAIVREIAAEMQDRTDRGEVASYIPELACVDSQKFGLAVVAADGSIAAAGDCDVPFSIQSISKVTLFFWPTRNSMRVCAHSLNHY